MADASIYSLMRPIQPGPGPLEQYGQAMTLKNLMGQGELHDLQRQQMQRSMDEERAVSDAYIRSKGDPRTLKELLLAGGHVKAAQAFEAANLKTEETRSTIDKNKATAGKTNIEALDKSLQIHRDQLTNVNDPQSAAQWVTAAFNDPALAPVMGRVGSLESVLARIPQDPQQFQQWKLQNGLGLEKFTADLRARAGQAITLRGQDLTRQSAIEGHDVTKRGQDISASTSRRGQDLTDARTREATEAGKTQIVTDNEGNVTIVNKTSGISKPAADAAGQPLKGKQKETTEAERVSAGYATRMEKSGKIIDNLETKGTGKPGYLESLYRGIGAETAANVSQAFDPQRQQYRQAQEDWVRAKLRKESGAVIASDEMDREIRVYFPQIGDTSAVVKQKAASRKTAEGSMRTAAGRAGASVDTRSADPAAMSDEELKRALGI